MRHHRESLATPLILGLFAAAAAIASLLLCFPVTLATGALAVFMPAELLWRSFRHVLAVPPVEALAYKAVTSFAIVIFQLLSLDALGVRIDKASVDLSLAVVCFLLGSTCALVAFVRMTLAARGHAHSTRSGAHAA